MYDGDHWEEGNGNDNFWSIEGRRLAVDWSSIASKAKDVAKKNVARK